LLLILLTGALALPLFSNRALK